MEDNHELLVYIITQTNYEYNDEINTANGIDTLKCAYLFKEEAEKKCKELNKEKLKGLNICNYTYDPKSFADKLGKRKYFINNKHDKDNWNPGDYTIRDDLKDEDYEFISEVFDEIISNPYKVVAVKLHEE